MDIHIFKKIKLLSASIFYSMLIGFSAFGDDIEIYYGISDQNKTVNPNVIFVFDTSGSMARTDGTQTSRMFKSREALKQAINNISDVNVSLMRFSSKGGPVLMKAEDIDKSSDENVIVRTIFGNNDFAVTAQNQDIISQFSVAGLTAPNQNRRHAMRFVDMKIPRYAIIESAHITYFSAGNENINNSLTFKYVGSTANNPGPFENGEDFSDLFYNNYDDDDGLALTATSCNNNGAVCWNQPEWDDSLLPVNSIDISEVVQKIVDQSNWNAGDPMVIFGEASIATNDLAYRVRSHSVAANDSTRRMSPQLRVRYSMPFLSVFPNNYTIRDKFVSLLEEFVAEGGTPVVDTMFEAFLYINGKGVDLGATRGGTTGLVSLLTRTSHPDTYSGSTRTIPNGCDPEKLTDRDCRFMSLDSPGSAIYNTPVDPDIGQCQANYIVLFSDGAANATTQASSISTAIGSNCNGEACAEALATYMATKPSDRGVNNNDAQIFTYTVGFESSGFNSTYLENLAQAGSGTFYSGNTINELADAFSSILIEAKKGASTFVAPGISVNQFNRLTHSNDIYYALFDPKSTEYWPGNLKKYKLIDSVVLDNTSTAAIASDGFFKDSAHDWWATSASLTGPFVGRGGAASRQATPRKVYSNMANSTSPFVDGDTRLTKSKLAITGKPNSNDLRLSMVDWIRGYDATDRDGDGVTNEPRHQMADPLHSEPLFFQYENESSVFIGTNEGYLLSIDADSGEENWAFIPEDLLPNLYNYYEDDNVFNSRTYGMDGAINAWTEDGKNYIIVGQRRGGRNYYVLDVTSRTQPVFKYMIEGGEGDYEDLGQSWSKPTITKIKVNGTEKRVFVIGGGYDTNQDSNIFRDQDDVGTSVFIVDVSDGSLIAEIKEGGNHDVNGMDYSIPSRVAVIDRDFDGFMDHMYFADMGGNLFRVDVYNDESLSNMFKGEKIYTTSLNLSRSKNRRFYYAPDVAEIVHQQEHYYAVSIGSGYRAHPLNEDIDDSVLMIKDKGVFAPDEDGEYTFPNIGNIAQLSASTPSVDDISSYDGYEFNLTRGEKVITGVTVINSKLIFTTYDPSTAGLIENSCSAAQGGGRLYIIDLLDGSAIQDNDGDGDVDYEDTFITLDKSGIPAEPRLIITDPEAPTICIGTECADTVISDDDQNDEFKRFTSSISGLRSRLNQVFTNSWSTDIEPTTKDDN
ncbi:PilC/PilY family type IV pilus protein [Psychrosphaera haliotis]|uniref:PilY1 beta-propeller domain-containing protein n=1 Tax=Psychrosphaera haliotis TaxID=555083 RepID=A0A6N8F9C2_9GAMM|nr:PilC/PilY family type IV pilus protein [Psychrosphaera haliotis]MUH71510.1 hypothetical protein [Psychrosphaera haliotis]